MERNDYKQKVFILLTLVISVFGLSIGFAAYSQTLQIKSSVGVQPDAQNFSANVKFDVASLDCSNDGNAYISEDDVTFSNNDTELGEIDVLFKAPGDSVTCTVDVVNSSIYDAFLKEISFGGALQCTSNNSDTAAKICSNSGVVATVTVGEHSATVTGIAQTNNTSIAEDNLLVSNTGKETVTFKVEYLNTTNSAVDENVTVTVPTLTLIYKSSND